MSRQVVVGEILGAFGVRGWVKVKTHTHPPENILKYSPWYIAGNNEAKGYALVEGKRHGEGLVIARLEGLIDRDQAQLLQRHTISVSRDSFPQAKPGEYYWVDLIGLEVHTLQGTVLGKVVNMMETGANDVIEVQGDRERLIPFVVGDFVKEVRINEGLLIVDWDPDF